MKIVQSIIKYNQHDNLQLDMYNFANLLNIVIDSNKSYFNCTKTIKFRNLNKISPSLFNYYVVKQGDTWTNISYKFYNTYKLWWLICKFNDVTNPFIALNNGLVIKIPNQKLVQQILEMIKE